MLAPAIAHFYRGIVNSQVFFSMMVGGSVPDPVLALSQGGGKSPAALKLAEQMFSHTPEKDTPEIRTLTKTMVKVVAAGGWLE